MFNFVINNAKKVKHGQIKKNKFKQKKYGTRGAKKLANIAIKRMFFAPGQSAKQILLSIVIA